mgnify:CR=1 FL=1
MRRSIKPSSLTSNSSNARAKLPGNIGAAARALKNMGLGNLVLVNPQRFPDPEARFRAASAVELVDAKRLERDQYQEKLEKAALKVQRCFRGWQSRRRVQEMRANKEEMLRKMIELENWSAVRIQSLFRGYAGRLVAAKALREHKGKWKEMWDQDKSRPFYYNQISGEIRWRKPQALLDLMRRPICHNCEFYEALIECQNCIEFYCNTCWETVHYSGKRRKHKFRSLYDYYEKRVDYGDNEFPSRWPSEVEQDEMVGWQL